MQENISHLKPYLASTDGSEPNTRFLGIQAGTAFATTPALESVRCLAVPLLFMCVW